MKNWMALILIGVIIVLAAIAGYQFKECPGKYIIKVPVLREDPYLVQKIDSFKTVDRVHHYFIDSLKRQLSQFSRYSNPVPAYKLISLPCDTYHTVDSLQYDIALLKEIIITQDSTIALDGRFTIFLRNTIQDNNDKLADLQYKFNQEAEKQKRIKKKVFLTGLGTGAAFIFAVGLLF